jgi:hypothetical protein
MCQPKDFPLLIDPHPQDRCRRLVERRKLPKNLPQQLRLPPYKRNLRLANNSQGGALLTPRIKPFFNDKLILLHENADLVDGGNH